MSAPFAARLVYLHSLPPCCCARVQVTQAIGWARSVLAQALKNQKKSEELILQHQNILFFLYNMKLLKKGQIHNYLITIYTQTRLSSMLHYRSQTPCPHLKPAGKYGKGMSGRSPM